MQQAGDEVEVSEKNSTVVGWKELFLSVFWPAAAGNVFWAFCTLWVKSTILEPEILARLVSLLLVTLYLTACWMRAHNIDPKFKRFYWIYDLFHVWSIVLFAIAAQEVALGLPDSLGAIYIVAIVGHLSGFWIGAREEWMGTIKHRMLLASISGLGLAILWFGSHLHITEPWNLPISLAVVVVLWGCVARPEVLANTARLFHRQ